MTTTSIIWVRNLNRRRIRATNACARWTLIMQRLSWKMRTVRKSIVALRLGRRNTYAMDALRFIMAAKDAAPLISDAVSEIAELSQIKNVTFF